MVELLFGTAGGALGALSGLVDGSFAWRDLLPAILGGLAGVLGTMFILYVQAHRRAPVQIHERAATRARERGAALRQIATDRQSIDAAVRHLRTRHSQWLADRTLNAVDLTVLFGPDLADWMHSRGLSSALMPRDIDGAYVRQMWLAHSQGMATNAATHYCEEMHGLGFLEKKTEPFQWRVGKRVAGSTDYYRWNAAGRALYEHVVNLPSVVKPDA